MKNPAIIIDAGHGGADGGGGSNQHWLEKDLALKISKYQYFRFWELHIPVAMTRDKDVYIAPNARAEMVRNSGAPICISNHINAGGGQGAEVIKSIYDRTDLGEMIADFIKREGQNIRRVFTRTLSSDHTQDYYFMHRQTGPVATYIVEYGFADNATDTKRLLDNWQKYAEAVVKATCHYLQHPYYEPVLDGYVENPQPTETSWEGKKVPELAKAKFVLDGQKIDDGIIHEGRTYAPVRSLLESLGLSFRWDNETKTVYIESEK